MTRIIELTDSDVQFLVNALEVAREQYEKDARTIQSAPQIAAEAGASLQKQFEQQAQKADEMSTLLADAQRVQVVI